MSTAAGFGRPPVARGVVQSIALHGAALAAALVGARTAAPPHEPPVYRVSLVAAAPNDAPATPSVTATPAAGPIPAASTPVSASRPTPQHPTDRVPVASTSATVRAPAVPLKPRNVRHPLARATTAAAMVTRSKSAANARTTMRPTPDPHAAGRVAPAPTPPRANGAAAPVGSGRGRDVADVQVRGLDFPFPGYLDNLVRQVRLRFSPAASRAGLRAELAFVIARDGGVTGLRVVHGSGDYGFDLEAQGAVEAAAGARAFGPLPDGFRPNALPVTFSFDPRSTP